MTLPKRSLRAAIGKWLGTDTSAHFRLARIGRSEASRWRCVRIDVDSPSGPLSIMFFRHDDGSWHVFPPNGRRPAIGGSRYVGQFPFDGREQIRNLARA
jgi:hypothetical protein